MSPEDMQRLERMAGELERRAEAYRGLSGCAADVAGWEADALALRAAIASLKGEDWQDIATAPRDGTHMLVTGMGYWEQFWAVAYWDGEAWRQQDDDGASLIPPTHWRPLPAPPRAALAGDAT